MIRNKERREEGREGGRQSTYLEVVKCDLYEPESLDSNSSSTVCYLLVLNNLLYFLSLNFLICKIGTILVPTSKCIYEDCMC